MGAERIVERLTPARPVWVDLAMVYPIGGRPRGVVPAGVDLQEEVPGVVTLRGVTTTGHEIVWVEYRLAMDGVTTPVRHWVFIECVSYRRDAPSRR